MSPSLSMLPGEKVRLIVCLLFFNTFHRVIMTDTTTVEITPKQELLDLINHDNGTNLTFDTIDLSDPVPNTETARNTKVTLTCKPNMPYKGTMDFYYNRLAMSALGYVGILTDIPIDNAAFLDFISSQAKIDLLADEFESFSIPVLESGQIGTINLIAKPTAVKWYGQLAADYAFGTPAGLDEFHTLLNVTLPAPGYLT